MPTPPSPSSHATNVQMWRALHMRPGTAAGHGTTSPSSRVSNWQEGPLSSSIPRIENQASRKRQQLKSSNFVLPGQVGGKYQTGESSNVNQWQQFETNTGRAVYSYCRFCQNNGESAEIFLSHVTKESNGAVQCPVLRSYKCPVCGQTGDRAHTVSYCPRNRTGGDRKVTRLEKENETPTIPTPMVGHLMNINTKK